MTTAYDLVDWSTLYHGDTQSAACREQASSPKTHYLAQKHFLCHVITFGQAADCQQ
jgi:hypothetical protein